MTALRMLLGGDVAPRSAVGTGALTTGTISTITNDSYYNAWPFIIRNDSDLVVAYTKSFTHHTENSGNMKIKISSDSGASYGSEIQGYFTLSLWSTVMGITRLSTGRLIASMWRDDTAVAGTGQTGVVYSDDDGALWSSWIGVTNSFSQESFAAGSIVELPGGDLLLPVEGSNVGQAISERSCHTLRSTDGGLTWGDEVSVRDYTDDSRPYYETCLLILDTGELIAIHRTSGGTGTHYIQRSTDQGATDGGWAAPSAIFSGYGKPNFIQGSSGTLIAITRRNSDAACVAFTSTDRGATWGSAHVIDATMTEMEYGCPVELGLGSYLVVYGSQPTGSISNADIKQAVVTETLA